MLLVNYVGFFSLPSSSPMIIEVTSDPVPYRDESLMTFVVHGETGYRGYSGFCKTRNRKSFIMDMIEMLNADGLLPFHVVFQVSKNRYLEAVLRDVCVDLELFEFCKASIDVSQGPMTFGGLKDIHKVTAEGARRRLRSAIVARQTSKSAQEDVEDPQSEPSLAVSGSPADEDPPVDHATAPEDSLPLVSAGTVIDPVIDPVIETEAPPLESQAEQVQDVVLVDPRPSDHLIPVPQSRSLLDDRYFYPAVAVGVLVFTALFVSLRFL